MSAKLIERRISAHEKVIALATEMPVMTARGGVSDTGEVRRSPQIMRSREIFEDWFTRFAQLCLEGTSWLSTETKREVNLVQDYLVTLHTYLEGVAVWQHRSSARQVDWQNLFDEKTNKTRYMPLMFRYFLKMILS
jgi:hypothetical protein